MLALGLDGSGLLIFYYIGIMSIFAQNGKHRWLAPSDLQQQLLLQLAARATLQACAVSFNIPYRSAV